MSASQSAQTDALYKKYQIRTSRGINTPIQNEEESITAIYSSQVARCPVPPNEATYLANKAAYPWIVQKTITYNANPALRVYTDTRVNNIIPFYNSEDAFKVTVGGAPLIQEQFTLDYDTGTLVLYSTPSENPTIKFCQYIGSKYVANQLLADGSDGEIVTVDASGTTRITQNLGTSLLKSPLQSQLNIQNKSTPGQFKLGTYFTTGDRGVSVIQSSNVWDGSDNGTDLLLNPFGGNIGVGKTNPTKSLDVSGAIKVTAGASATAEIICANGYSGNNNDGTENIISRIKLGNESYNASIRTVIPPTVVVGGDSFGDTCRLDLCTPQATNNNTEIPRLSVAPFTGNVGIGTTTPEKTLDVSGNAQIRGHLYLNGVVATNKICFDGTFNDWGTSLIEDRRYDTTGEGERSELLLVKGNDVAGSYGPDRIRLKAPEVCVQTATGGFTTDDGTNKLVINSSGVEIIGPMILTSSALTPANQNMKIYNQTMKLEINIPELTFWNSNTDSYWNNSSNPNIKTLSTRNYIYWRGDNGNKFMIIPPLCSVGWYEIEHVNDYDSPNLRHGTGLFCVISKAKNETVDKPAGWKIIHLRSSNLGGEFVVTSGTDLTNESYPVGFILGGLVPESNYYIRIRWSSL